MHAGGLSSVLALLGGGLAAFALAKASRLSIIVCFFVVGALLGSHGIGLVEVDSNFHILAEIGLAFFLFEVGSHLSVKKLIEEWRQFLILGPVHAALCSAGLALIALLCGTSVTQAALIGIIGSLSSTAVVLKILDENEDKHSPAAESATAVLLFQDIFAVVLLAILPAFQGDRSVAISLVVFKTLLFVAIAFIGVIVAARLAFKPFFRWVFSQRADEVFTASALFTVLLIAWAVSPLGLSLPFGAFLAGVCLSETQYSYLVRSELLPFRGLLLSLFFLIVGMELDLHFLATNLPLVLMVTVVFALAKIAFGILAFVLCRMELSRSLRVSSLLAQGSEFSFALIAVCVEAGLLSKELTALLSGTLGLSLAFATVVMHLGCRLSRFIAKDETEEETTDTTGSKEIIIVEFDEVGRELASALNAEGIPYRGHDRDWERLNLAKSQGYNVFFSNPDRPRTVSRAAMGEALAVVSLLEDKQIALQLVEGMRKLAPTVPLLAASKDPEIMERMLNSGVQETFLKTDHVTELLLKELYKVIGRSKSESAEAVARLRDRRLGTATFSELSLANT